MNHIPFIQAVRPLRKAPQAHDDVKELAKAVSTQAQVTNRIWLGLVTASVVGFTHGIAQNGDIKLPFGFGDVSPDKYWILLGSILFVLTTAFSAAHAQQVRAQQIAQRYLARHKGVKLFDKMVPLRTFFDFLRLPTFNRIGSLPQLIGGFQNYRVSERSRSFWASARGWYYAVLKFLSLFTYFGIPLAGIGYVLYKMFWTLPRWAFIAACLMAIVPLGTVFHLIYEETRGANEVRRSIANAKC